MTSYVLLALRFKKPAFLPSLSYATILWCLIQKKDNILTKILPILHSPFRALYVEIQLLQFKPKTTQNFMKILYHKRVHAVAQLVEALRYKPKVAGSIPDGVLGVFH